MEPLALLSVDNFQFHRGFSILDDALPRNLPPVLPKSASATNSADLGPYLTLSVLHHQLLHNRYRNDQNPDKTIVMYFLVLLIHKFSADEEHWESNILILAMGQSKYGLYTCGDESRVLFDIHGLLLFGRVCQSTS